MRISKQIGLAALVTAAGVVGTASAADLPRPVYTKAPPMVVLYNWSGVYVGVNVGGSWGRQNVTFSEPIATITNSVHPNGVIGGGQIGWNWQGPNSPWVFGLEADIQGSGQRRSVTFATADAALSLQDKLDWFGTVRARLGYASGDQGRLLFYTTGGLAYGETNINGSGVRAGVPFAFNASRTDIGWTIGSGIEWAFLDRWSAKLEYLFVQLDRGPTVALPASTISTGHFNDNIVRVGLNYRFGGF